MNKRNVFCVLVSSLLSAYSITGNCAEAARNVAPRLGDFARNADGSIRKMNQYDAEQYCLMRGSRLPNIRELALIARDQGAGFQETEFPNVSIKDPVVRAEMQVMQAKGFNAKFIRKGDNEEVSVFFYYNFKGYKQDSGVLENYVYHSSSVWSDRTSYYLYGRDGFIGQGNRSAATHATVTKCVE